LQELILRQISFKEEIVRFGDFVYSASIFPAVTALIFFSALSAAPLIPALTVLGLFISGQIAAAKIHRLYNASGKINDANLSYAEQLFKKEHKYSFKKFQRIMFIKSDKGLFASYNEAYLKKTETVFIQPPVQRRSLCKNQRACYGLYKNRP
jgi:hypothetical protein